MTGPAMDKRLAHYIVCQQRGHTPSGEMLTSNPPWQVCRFCGTWFRYETTMIEGNVPALTDGEAGG